MTIPVTLAADLSLLTEILDDSRSDVAATMSRLVSEAALALPSYVGLSVLVGDEQLVELTTIENDDQVAQIRSSLRFALDGGPGAGPGAGPSVVLVLYAARPGALVDLAADLTWLTGRAFGEAALDEDLTVPRAGSSGRSLRSASIVNQALGVLIGGGRTVAEAHAELDAQAAENRVERHVAAVELLAAPPGPHSGA